MKNIARYFFQIRLKLNEPDKQKKRVSCLYQQPSKLLTVEAPIAL